MFTMTKKVCFVPINSILSHLWKKNSYTTPNDSQFEVSSTSQSLTRRAKHQNRVLKSFTTQWKKDYPLSLRESAKTQSRGTSIISVGDIVVLKNEGTARIFWKLAKVEELIPSRDQVV